jgi:hypothetical protein
MKRHIRDRFPVEFIMALADVLEEGGKQRTDLLLHAAKI